MAPFGTEDARGVIPPCRKSNRDAVDSALNHAPDRQFHSLGVVQGRGKENLVVVLHREVFERLNDFGEKRIRDFGDDKAQKAAPPGNQAPSLGVGKVSQFVDNFSTPVWTIGDPPSEHD